MADRSAIQAAKAALPLPALWEKLGWPGQPRKSCLRPYSPEDSRESGSVFQKASGDWCFHDFKSGETFDEIDLLMQVEGLDKGASLRRYLDLAGVQPGAGLPPPQSAPRPPASPPDARPACKPYLGTLEELTRPQCEVIAASRGLWVEAVALAAAEGLLWRGERLGVESWVLTDAERWNAQFRRFDGSPYTLGDGRRVKTLGVKGGWAAWPIGLPAMRAAGYQRAVIVEGLPDALAAFQVLLESSLASSCAVICMTGSGLRLPAECLPAFAGVRVRIFCDADASGRAAALRWEAQLTAAGAECDAFDLSGLVRANGEPVKDLNDACLMRAAERAALGLMEGMA